MKSDQLIHSCCERERARKFHRLGRPIHLSLAVLCFSTVFMTTHFAFGESPPENFKHANVNFEDPNLSRPTEYVSDSSPHLPIETASRVSVTAARGFSASDQFRGMILPNDSGLRENLQQGDDASYGKEGNDRSPAALRPAAK